MLAERARVSPQAPAPGAAGDAAAPLRRAAEPLQTGTDEVAGRHFGRAGVHPARPRQDRGAAAGAAVQAEVPADRAETADVRQAAADLRLHADLHVDLGQVLRLAVRRRGRAADLRPRVRTRAGGAAAGARHRHHGLHPTVRRLRHHQALRAQHRGGCIHRHHGADRRDTRGGRLPGRLPGDPLRVLAGAGAVGLYGQPVQPCPHRAAGRRLDHAAVLAEAAGRRRCLPAVHRAVQPLDRDAGPDEPATHH